MTLQRFPLYGQPLHQGMDASAKGKKGGEMAKDTHEDSKKLVRGKSKKQKENQPQRSRKENISKKALQLWNSQIQLIGI